jgi:hypothetical protein
LPDGVFSNQKYQIGNTLGGFGKENVDIFYGHLVYFTPILVQLKSLWYILWFFVEYFPVLVCCSKTNLTTKVGGQDQLFPRLKNATRTPSALCLQRFFILHVNDKMSKLQSCLVLRSLSKSSMYVQCQNVVIQNFQNADINTVTSKCRHHYHYITITT